MKVEETEVKQLDWEISAGSVRKDSKKIDLPFTVS